MALTRIGNSAVPSGAVTQHVTETDLQPVKSDISALALREATNESSAAFNLPNQFIDTFTDDTNLGTQTNVDRTSGYISSIIPGTGIDSNTVLMISSNTTDGSTTFTDTSLNAMTGFVLAGSTHHDTAYKRFGTSSIKFVSNGDRLTTPDLAANDPQVTTPTTGDFTADFWLRGQSGAGDRIYSIGLHSSSCPRFTYAFNGTAGSASSVNFYGYNGSSCTNDTTSASTYDSQSATYTDGWSHQYIMRKGSNMYWGQDGVQKYIFTFLGNQDMQYGTGKIGLGYRSGSAGEDLTGWIDEFRYSNIARYGIGSNGDTIFTPETSAYTGEVANATGTLIQSANAVGSAKTKVGGTMLYKDNEGTATLGTDLKIYFTCNGGSNWTEASSYTAITPVYSTGIKQVRLGETTCTSGTDVRYKAVWANQASGSKETQLHGIGVNY